MCSECGIKVRMLRRVYILFQFFHGVLEVNKTSVENIAFDFEFLTARAVTVKKLDAERCDKFTPRICTQQALEIVSRTSDELSRSTAFSEENRPRFCACADCAHTSERNKQIFAQCTTGEKYQ